MRSASVNGPTRDIGGRMSVRSHHRGFAFVVKQRNKRLPDFQFLDGAFRIEIGIGPERLRGGSNGFLLFRREGAKCVLNAIAELR